MVLLDSGESSNFVEAMIHNGSFNRLPDRVPSGVHRLSIMIGKRLMMNRRPMDLNVNRPK